MSKQDLDALLNLIKADLELRNQLAACTTPEQAQEIITAAGFAVSVDEILSLRSGIAAMELSDANLEGVAGGRDKGSNADTCRNRGCPGG